MQTAQKKPPTSKKYDAKPSRNQRDQTKKVVEADHLMQSFTSKASETRVYQMRHKWPTTHRNDHIITVLPNYSNETGAKVPRLRNSAISRTIFLCPSAPWENSARPPSAHGGATGDDPDNTTPSPLP